MQVFCVHTVSNHAFSCKCVRRGIAKAGAACARAACRGAASCAGARASAGAGACKCARFSMAAAMCKGDVQRRASRGSQRSFRVASRSLPRCTPRHVAANCPDRRACFLQLMGLPLARGEKNCCLFDGSRFARRVVDRDSSSNGQLPHGCLPSLAHVGRRPAYLGLPSRRLSARELRESAV